MLFKLPNYDAVRTKMKKTHAFGMRRSTDGQSLLAFHRVLLTAWVLITVVGSYSETSVTNTKPYPEKTQVRS
jgi:hypothetical protein